MSKESKNSKGDAVYVRLHESQRIAIAEIVRRSEGRMNRTDFISAAIDWYIAHLAESGKGPEVRLDFTDLVDQFVIEEKRRRESR